MENTLRETLHRALLARHATLRHGWCRQKDIDLLRASIGRVEVFLRSFPAASDERVREWCRLRERDVRLVVPSNMKKVLVALVG